ncbi:DUF4157 domain-containing protein [Actinacidiphila oryziradicis]|uniref:eCIS core domain-containing protein n=1 Tax=Actinacidiphila oryziradicis TaxID=2571141 RepID=UPI0023F1B337|nr:DUF4157 domain-containing protein [Actinacidiphila oryziradicis]
MPPTAGMTAAGIMSLQRSVGNAAVARMVEAERHEHGAGCGHEQAPAPVQRRSVAHEVLNSPGEDLDSATRTEMEGRYGRKLPPARVHRGPLAERAAEELGAQAFTSQGHMVFGRGAWNKPTIAHEMRHLEHQAAGPVPGADNGNGFSVSHKSDDFEKDAEASSVQAMRAPVQRVVQEPQSAASADANAGSGIPVQRQAIQRVTQVQRVTTLAKQQGPSCWLYVLEAIANAYNIEVSYLSLAMRAYPSTPDRDDRAIQERIANPGKPVNGRHLAVLMMGEGLAKMVARLDSWRASPEGGAEIDRESVSKLARRSLKAESSVERLEFQEGKADFDGIVNAYREAHKRAVMLAGIVGGAGDEVSKLLNTAPAEIDGKQSLPDVHMALVHQSMPSYAGIRKRFKPGKKDTGDVVDCTHWSDSDMEPTVHAVLLDSYDKGARVVTYKDPNFGNAEFKVTIAQFQKMAGTAKITLRPFFPSGAAKSRLTDLKD